MTFLTCTPLLPSRKEGGEPNPAIAKTFTLEERKAIAKEATDVAQCTISNRTVKLGKEFITKFDSQAELLTKRLQKITGLRMQQEGLLKGTFGYAIGERETKALVPEMLWIAKRYDAKAPRALIA